MQKSRGWRLAPAAFLIAAGIALGAALPGSDDAPPAKPQAADPPPGTLLIASETMGDPRFSHAVILILSHDSEGAFGIVVNRPLEEKPIADILAAAADGKDQKKAGSDLTGKIRIFAGGPVQPELGFVVHTPDYKGEGTLTVPDIVAMTPTTDILRDIGHAKGPAKYFFALGYAGWGPGQLDDEIQHHDWFSTPGDPKLIFDDDRNELWKRALERRTQDL